MTLDEIRKKIDEIDGRLLPLFEDRMDCSKEVARIKKGQGLPILNEAREQAVLENISEKARAYPGEARVLYAACLLYTSQPFLFISYPAEYPLGKPVVFPHRKDRVRHLPAHELEIPGAVHHLGF